MAKLGISTGAVPDDGTGSSLLVGAARVNSNFDELYTLLGAGSTTNLAPGIVTSIVAGDNISVSGGTGQVTITGSAGTSHVNTSSLNVSGISTLGVTSITDDVVVYTGKSISLTDENTIHFINGSGNADVIRWGSASDNLRIGFNWGSYSSAAAIYSDYTMNLDGGRTNISASGTSSSDMVYLNSSNGVDIRTNATVTGILTASNVSTAGSVTAATLFGDGSNLTGITGELSEVDLWEQSSKGSSTGNLALNVLLGGAQARSPVGVRATSFFSKVGTGMTHTAGIWTFPSTGMWEVLTNVALDGNTSGTLSVWNRASSDSGGNWTIIGETDFFSGNGDITLPLKTLINVTNASTFRFKAEVSSDMGHAGLYGGRNGTHMSFKKLA